MLSPQSLREQFPVLSREINGRPLVYLDNAATSLKPQRVLQAEHDFYAQCGANIHRGKHALSLEASDAYEQARDVVTTFLNAATPREVIFVANTTDALNTVASGLGLGPDDEVLSTSLEHHSSLLPFMRAARTRLVDVPVERPWDPADLLGALTPATRVVVMALASNVTGVIQPVAEVCRACRERGILTVVDAAQAAAHVPIDVQALGCDFLAFSGHKALGPMGTGVLYGREVALTRLNPMRLGGGTVDRVKRDGFTLRGLPHRLEAGTPNVGGVLGLAAAVRLLEECGLPDVMAHGEALSAALYDGLARIPGIRALMGARAPRLPIASIVLERVALSADDVAMMLSDRHAIMTRSGFHCAHPFFDALGVGQGTLRASALAYNTVDEIGRFCAALEEVIAPFRR